MTAIEFNERFEELRPTMFAFAMKLTRNVEDANDLMQETSFRAFRSLERFKDGTHFKSWIRNTTIAYPDGRTERTNRFFERRLQVAIFDALRRIFVHRDWRRIRFEHWYGEKSYLLCTQTTKRTHFGRLWRNKITSGIINKGKKSSH